MLESTWVLLFLNWQVNVLEIITNVSQLHLVSLKCKHYCASRPQAPGHLNATRGLGLGLSTGREGEIHTCQTRFSAPGRVAQGLQCDLPSLEDSRGGSLTKALEGSKRAL